MKMICDRVHHLNVMAENIEWMDKFDKMRDHIRAQYPDANGFGLVRQSPDGKVCLLGTYPDWSILSTYLLGRNEHFFWVGDPKDEPSAQV